ncbi:hypothetical protein AB1Y20_016848 [Prymnesium parvum]|uniref:Complex I-ESSS n=1 Tax=Prymnesium parvum TaxID=97485 RepID=A0AB34IAY7_PRYPA
MLRTLFRPVARAGLPRAALSAPRRLAGGPAAFPPRTPERTAELERLAEEHNGFLFGEPPLPEGQTRKKEDWEYTYIPLMSLAFIMYGVIYAFQPEDTTQWARTQALMRKAAAEKS